MTQAEFTDAVLERLYVQGFSCPNLPLLSAYTRVEGGGQDAWPDPDSFTARCVTLPGVTHQPQLLGKCPSRLGARDRWLAVHEAGHAIVGIKAGFTLRGVRFYGEDGFPGEAGLEDVAWAGSRDEDLLRRLIRVDVAGNVAEILHPDCDAPHGLLSALYDDRTPGDRPTDFISADARARHLARVLFDRRGAAIDADEIWKARRAIVEHAEAEAEQVLRDRLEALTRLADQLQRGPMTGSAVRAVVGG